MSFVDSFTYNVFRKNFGLSSRKRYALKAGVELEHKLTFDYRIHEALKGGDGAYHIKDVKLPILDKKNEKILFQSVYFDTFYSYVFLNDRYDEETVNICDSILPEGLYGLQNDKVNVTVEPNDIVIDAGAWIGDFSAYASVRGATVYAFEPTENTFNYLLKTAELNKNIIPVNKGLSDKNAHLELFINTANSAGNTILSYRGTIKHKKSQGIEITKLDDFVKENNLAHVDFIKSDIEGAERDMLAGARETLKNFAPKLALCTYHLLDDPIVLAERIKEINPNYNIVHKNKKLYASVPK